jgi:1,4-dihydroxy-2-naphthoate octaprenyltransferase
LAGEDFKAVPALLALCVSLCLQIAVNYSNDYSDGIRGTDDNRIGPVRLTASGLAPAESVKRAAILSFAAASIAGIALAALSSWWVILLGVAAIAAAWGYTGGKNPYGYKGLGEMSVFIFFGVVATMGSYYVQTLEVNWVCFAASVPMGSLSCALLAINNIRDRQQDEIVGKRTLAVRLGDRGSRVFFVLLLASAYIFAALTGHIWVLLTLITVPMTYFISKKVLQGATGSELIPLLGSTGKLQILFAITFAIALAL